MYNMYNVQQQIHLKKAFKHDCSVIFLFVTDLFSVSTVSFHFVIGLFNFNTWRKCHLKTVTETKY